MKAPFFITGPVGAGKTSMMVNLMVEYLNEGRPVATNIDVFTEKMPLNELGKKTPIIRLPDEVRSSDLMALGRAYPIGPNGEGFDEKRNGGLFLDETGFFMNSREWNASDRMRLIKWLRLVRKKGWNAFLGVQDLDSIDNQIVNALCRTVGWCHSSDTLMAMSANPIAALLFLPIKLILKLFIRFVLRVPRVHMCSFYGGRSVHAGIKQSTVMAWGKWLYESYNTAQEFTDGFDELEKPITNAKGEVKITFRTTDGTFTKYVRHETVHMIPDAHIEREIVSVDMRAIYTVLPATYTDRWYGKPKTPDKPKPTLHPFFWPQLPFRMIVWASVALFAKLHGRKWRDEAKALGLIRHQYSV